MSLPKVDCSEGIFDNLLFDVDYVIQSKNSELRFYEKMMRIFSLNNDIKLNLLRLI